VPFAVWNFRQVQLLATGISKHLARFASFRAARFLVDIVFAST
jgi:hypothetical protein